MSERSDDVTIRRVTPTEVIDLRHLVLRQGLPRDAAIFPGDDAPASRHYGAFRGAELLCCVTLHPSDWKGEPAWQLRGMATAPGHQRRGLGRRVLEYLEADIRAEGAFRLLWCNARVPAVNFYWRMGWSATSDQFDIPTAGPHVRMVKRLG